MKEEAFVLLWLTTTLIIPTGKKSYVRTSNTKELGPRFRFNLQIFMF